MANSLSFPFSIYRLTTGGDTELSIGDAEGLGFEYGIDRDIALGLTSFQVGIPQRKTDVPNVGQRSTSKPATSLVSFPINIGFIVNETVQDNPKPLAKLMKWSLEDQDVRGTFSKGRLCLRNDNATSLPEIIAELDAGIRFVDIIWDDEVDWSNHQTGTIQLEYVGTYTSFITNLNTIINAP